VSCHTQNSVNVNLWFLLCKPDKMTRSSKNCTFSSILL